ncbi:GNAT family N-acetyltransferase [Actinotalea sp. Marseille-Q4924]|uniref:GNAT family N-acetyltransferase n=1 Tax=Actinotalea sp. Marseille-Q4924 TaxID=2866571 RepID=UPI001CE46773|nr:GNAT family N-acetyltransferase [Actinotalea sp. Marseille-Q4924]
MTRASIEPVIRDLRADDLEVLASLNDAAVPAVTALGTAGLARHVRRCAVALVTDAGAGPDGFLLALAPGAEYPSENYRWFSEHRPGSLYVDRIVVAPAAHGLGRGRALYGTTARRAVGLGLAEVTCEVNLDPPNPGSLAFHRRLGFEQVGTQRTSGGTVEVALLAAPSHRLVRDGGAAGS